MKKKPISIKELSREVDRLKAAAPLLRIIQAEHLIVLWNKFGKDRLMICFENWGICNLDRLQILKAFKDCKIQPGLNRRFKHKEVEKLRSIV